VIAPRARIAVLVAVAALAAAGCGASGTLGAKSLTKRSEAVQSLAAEGALLAADSAAGRSTGVFRREHSAELGKAAATVERSLASARTTPALRPKLHALHAIAARVRVALARLGGASRAEQRALARRLDDAAKASEQLGQAIA
jgi:hypothetical protein